MANPPTESAASRYNREYQQIPVAVSSGDPEDGTWNGLNNDNRKARTLDNQTAERKSRQFVNPDTFVSSVNAQAPHGEGYLGDGEFTSDDPIVQGAPFPQGVEPEPEEP